MGSIGGLFFCPSRGQGTLPVARQPMLSSIRLALKQHAVNLAPQLLSYSVVAICGHLWPYVAGRNWPSTPVVGVGWDRMRMGGVNGVG